uniref:B14.5a n=1 Tax=Polytomella sp. Pringsheim 198.80 TaxID=37502 RepID=UPI001E1E241A|nr:Chain r, B14.5a [Polytomella sp. Pringsheim 198.80]7ARD_r Chain r, B14.5a [Polytomella sp. Pringsheim 198.80]
MSGILKTVQSIFYSVGLKEPWKMTGIRSLPDFEYYLPFGLTYRGISPGNQPIKAVVPHDVPKLVYDIKYFARDYRRNNSYTVRSVDSKTPFDYSKVFGSAPLKPADVKTVRIPEVMPHRGC